MTRIRTFKNRNTAGSVAHSWSNGLPSVIEGTRVYSENDTMVDYVIKNFRKRSANGEIFNNPMSRTTVHQEPGSGTRSAYRLSDGVTMSSTGDIVGWLKAADRASGPNAPSSFLETVRKMRDNALLHAIAGIDKPDFAFGEDLLEIRKTVETLRRPLALFDDLNRTFARSQSRLIGRGFTVAQATSMTWLQLRYKYRQLMISYGNIVESELVSREPKQPVRKTSRGKYEQSYNVQTSPVYGPRTYGFSNSGSVKGRYGILYQINPPSRPGLDRINEFNRRNGLRLSDVPKSLWAIVPYSWVIDRFVNVSNLIQAYANLSRPGLVVLAAWHTVTSVTETQAAVLSDNSPGWSVSFGASSQVLRTTSKTRTPVSIGFSSIPLPKYTGETWSNLEHVADLTALAVQNLARLLRKR